MDWLNVAATLVGPVAGAVDPYFYTEQERAKDSVAAGNTAATVTTSNNALAAIQGQQRVQEQVIKFTLLGVLGAGSLYLAAQLVGQGQK